MFRWTTYRGPDDQIRHKQLSHVEIKSPDEGQVSAVFSTFNVLDWDNDVTLPEAFEDGAEVVISGYQHTSWGGAFARRQGLYPDHEVRGHP